ncbi:hypothetical protein A462_27388 [Pseudomonas sp. Ag1]|nr:hypothetical protein A462_27388 [Pseudomonas sp. Ag1]
MNLVRILPIAFLGGFVIKSNISFFIKEPLNPSFLFYIFTMTFLMSLLGVFSLTALRTKCAIKDASYISGFKGALKQAGEILVGDILSPGEYINERKLVIKDAAVCFLAPSLLVAAVGFAGLPAWVSLIVLGVGVCLWSAQLNSVQSVAYRQIVSITDK